jgi:hypothetical protein
MPLLVTEERIHPEVAFQQPRFLVWSWPGVVVFDSQAGRA